MAASNAFAISFDAMLLIISNLYTAETGVSSALNWQDESLPSLLPLSLVGFGQSFLQKVHSTYEISLLTVPPAR
eukprot:10954702-Ditylum_brightwellii.AAC.1